VSNLRIYTNESAAVAVATGLRLRNVDAWSTRDAGNLGLSDEAQLEYACRERAVVFTHDADFLALAQQWTTQGKEHWGVIFVHEQRLGIGECIRRLIDYALFLQAEDMKNQIEFL
jgi:hypothetical protein